MLRKTVERMNVCIRNQEEHIINTIDNLSCSFMKKKLFYFVFVALTAMTASLLSLTSCSKDDDKKEEIDPVAELKAKFVGEWNFVGSYDTSGKRIDDITVEIHRVFEADGTHKGIVAGKYSNTTGWEVEVKGSERILRMGTLVMKILNISANTFEITSSEGSYDLYVRTK